MEAALSQRWPENKLDPSLERIRDLLGLLGDPHRSCPVVHIAGTNGKTSTARLIDGLLREAGLRTGLMTSPHLDRVTERISLHGAPLDEERFVAAYDEIAPYLPLVDALYSDRTEQFIETQVKFEDGRTGRISATLKIHPAKVFQPVARAA